MSSTRGWRAGERGALPLGLHVDVRKVRQYPRDAPAVVDFAVLGEAVVMVVPRRATVPLRRRHISETVQRAGEAANVATRSCGRDHFLEQSPGGVVVTVKLGGVRHIAGGEIDGGSIAELRPERHGFAEPRNRLGVSARLCAWKARMMVAVATPWRSPHSRKMSRCEGGLMLDMSQLRGVQVDPARRVARAEPGCLLGDVDRETQAHGLAAVLGFVSATGCAGLTLGGGFGYLTRRFGWTSDNLAAIELVTADGRVVRASEDQNRELFWGLCGGGGNFGVAMSFEYKLHPVGPEVVAGAVAWRGEEAGSVLELY